MIKTNGVFFRMNESARFSTARIRIIHFSLRNEPLSILLKNAIPMITETPAGIQIPRIFKTDEGCSTIGKKKATIAKTKTAIE